MAVKKKSAKKKSVKKNIKKAAKKVVKKPVKKTGAKSTKKTSVKKNKNVQSKKTLLKSVKKTAIKKPALKKISTQKTQTPTAKIQIDYTKTITPLLDRLVVRVLNNEKITAGGLIIPESASMATGYLKAEVLAVGTGIKSKKGYLKPLDVQVGDHVLFSEYAGTKVEFNSESLQIIHESDVMGILQK